MLKLKQADPTIFFKSFNGILQRLVRISAFNGDEPTNACLKVKADGWPDWESTVRLPSGESALEAWAPDVTSECLATFTLETAAETSSLETLLRPQRKWTVHVVQASHHDPGYTDLPSVVLRQHDRWLDEAIDMAEHTEAFPDDAKFHIVVEQAWSIDHFLKHAPADRAAKAISLLRTGRFELTALFGNMTTELCGHETLIRTAYHAFALKRRYGIPIISAEHNDITGISWGLSRVLADADVKFFCPGIPLYYNWGGGDPIPSFWDQKAVFGREGPGAFWWETQDNKRVLFWCGNSGCGGGPHSDLPGLVSALSRFEEQGYPWPVARWPVSGGARDNSPYIEGYAHTVRAWNEQWAFPHLVCSTNAKFYADFSLQDLSALPVWRGELPGQDYPSGATSTAAATAANRTAHSLLTSAEKAASAASLYAGFSYPAEVLAEAYEETLWHDEHAWGFHFPCGPAMRASQFEKALHAYRAEALAHGAASKAMAGLADSISAESGFALVVFNPTSWEYDGVVRSPLREMDNTGSEMRFVMPETVGNVTGYLKGYVLGYRFHTGLPEDIIEGRFDLLDAETGERVPFQIVPVDDPMQPIPYSEDRIGIGSGTKRVGLFEIPSGLKIDLCFVARRVPAMGYRTYRLVPGEQVQFVSATACSGGGSIENEFYRVDVGSDGSIRSFFDKQANRELVDVGRDHGFLGLVVQAPDTEELPVEECLRIQTSVGEVLSEIRVYCRAPGHPQICKTITLYKGVGKAYLDMKVLKDPTPLLSAYLAFPFEASQPRFRYEGGLSQIDPVRDNLPGAFIDTLAVQSWVKVRDDNYSILWSSLDAPIASLARLWPGYVSPAHRCVMDKQTIHAPQTEKDLDRGWIFCQLFNNNFGTNFSVSQTGEALFRYVITTTQGDITDTEATRFGWQAAESMLPMLTDRCRPCNVLPPITGFLKTNNDAVVVLAWKQAEDDDGMVLRIWNLSDCTQTAGIEFTGCTCLRAERCNICEETKEAFVCRGSGFQIDLAPHEVATVRAVVSFYTPRTYSMTSSQGNPLPNAGPCQTEEPKQAT